MAANRFSRSFSSSESLESSRASYRDISDWMACSWAVVEARMLEATALPIIWLEEPKPRSMVVCCWLVLVGEK